MTCPRCARWIHLGLALLTSSFASAVNAATIEPPLSYAAERAAPPTLTLPLAPTVDEFAPRRPHSPAVPSELTPQTLSQAVLETSEQAGSPDQLLKSSPVEAFPSPRVFPPGEAISASELDDAQETEFLSNQALAALAAASDGLAESGQGDPLSSGESPGQALASQGSRQSAEALPDGAVPRSITIPPAVTEIPVAAGESLMAQITPDSTLGAEASVVTPDVVINNDLADQVEGGAIRGSNLFHSFRAFNVNTGQRVYFANPVGIENILSRVTGGNVSDIDGLLGVNGAANLFLLNPNGIIFGPNAELDIRGSFLASTADNFAFADGGEFSATNPQDGALLTMSAPLGVQFNIPSTGDIANEGRLETGQDLTLNANHLNLQGQLHAGGDLWLDAHDTVTIRDTATEAFVANAGGDLTIQGRQGIDILALQHLAQTPFVSGGDLTLSSDGVISTDAHFVSGGDFSIRTLSGEWGNFVSLYDPLITAGGDFAVGDYTGASLQVTAGGDITYGTVVIDAIDSLINPSNPAFLLAAGGAITGTGDVLTTVATGGLVVDFQSQGDMEVQRIETQGGDIDLRSIRDGITARADLDTRDGANDGGDITLTAEGNITTNGNLISSSFSSSVFGAAGSGGAISIFSNSGDITTEGFLFSSSFSDSGDAGSGGAITLSSDSGDITTKGLLVITLGDITIESSLVSSSSSDGDAGSGGAITLSSDSGDITIEGFLVSSSSSSSGDARSGGAITLSSDSGDITTKGLFSSSFSDLGDAVSGGAITLSSDSGDITTGDLDSGSYSYSGTAGSGGAITLSSDSGDITTGDLDSGSFSYSGDTGNGGAISISSTSGDITTGDLDSSSFSYSGDTGNGGAISISSTSGDIKTEVFLDSSSRSRSIDGNAGSGGAITISSTSGDITTEGFLDSSSYSDSGTAGSGGAITLSSTSGDITTGDLDSGSYSYSGTAGSGGAITLSSTSGDITTGGLDSGSSSDSGDAGSGGAITLSSDDSGDITTGGLDSGSSSDSGTAGSGGAITLSSTSGDITTEDLFSFSSSDSGTAGSGGAITLSSDSGDITTEGFLDSSSSSSSGDAGNGGAITLSSDSGDITTEGFLESFSFSELGDAGNGGAITLSSDDSGDITIGDLFSFSLSLSRSIDGNAGSGGAISLLARDGDIRGSDTTQLIAFSVAQKGGMTGAGGAVTLQANTISGLDVFTLSSAGPSGKVQIQGLGDSLAVRNLLLTTSGQLEIPNPFEDPGETIPLNLIDFGQSGNTSITSAGDLTLDNVEILGDTNGDKRAGDVTISSPGEIRLNDSQIFSDTNSTGEGGDITFERADSLILNNTQVTTDTSDEGIAGNIYVQDIGVFILRNNSRLLAEASSDLRNGGNVEINAGFVIAIPNENNDIIANAVGGNGGNIDITTNQLLGFTVQRGRLTTADLRNNTSNDISASSQFGQQGLITINDLFDPNQGLTELPTLSPTPPIQRGCSASTVGASSFRLTGRGGLPPSPEDIFNRDRTLADLGPETTTSDPPTHPVIHPPANDSPAPLVEAQGLIKDADGWVTFVAETPDATPPAPWRQPLQCSGKE